MKSGITHIDHKHYYHVNGDIGNKLVRHLLRVSILAILLLYTYAYAQSMVLCNLWPVWVVLRKIAIDIYFVKLPIDFLPVSQLYDCPVGMLYYLAKSKDLISRRGFSLF